MSAGIVIKTKFIQAKAAAAKGKGFTGYLNYMDRPEAARDMDLKKYDLFESYQDYMGNKEKSSGLFSADKDTFSKQGVDDLKKEFSLAQEKGSNLYQGIISFETDWLKKHGLINADGVLIENKMREYTRSAVTALLKEEDATNWLWSAAIHHNTNHYHVHIAIVEPEPSWKEGVGRCKRNGETGELYQRGKFKLRSIEKAKSTFVNLAIGSKEKNLLINEIIRDRILIGKKQLKFSGMHFDELNRKFGDLMESLPDDARLWNYNMNAMKPYRTQIDELSDIFIQRYFKEDYKEFMRLTEELSDSYTDSYGDSKKGNSFLEQKRNDLYSRLGNAILKECKEIRKEQQQQNIPKNIKGRSYSRYNAKRILFDLRNIFRKDIESLKNQAAYERLMQEERYYQ